MRLDEPVDAVVARDALRVLEDLVLRRAQARPVAALGERVRVHVARHVAGGARVAVLQPGAADAAVALEDRDVAQPVRLQLDRGGHPAEAGADDQDFELSFRSHARHANACVGSARDGPRQRDLRAGPAERARGAGHRRRNEPRPARGEGTAPRGRDRRDRRAARRGARRGAAADRRALHDRLGRHPRAGGRAGDRRSRSPRSRAARRAGQQRGRAVLRPGGGHRREGLARGLAAERRRHADDDRGRGRARVRGRGRDRRERDGQPAPRLPGARAYRRGARSRRGAHARVGGGLGARAGSRSSRQRSGASTPSRCASTRRSSGRARGRPCRCSASARWTSTPG